MTVTESRPFNMCDGVRYCNMHQGFTAIESIVLDVSNGRMKVDFSGIIRGTLMIEAPVSIDGGSEVGNVLCWRVSTEEEIIIPTSIFINPRDCEDPSFHRESEFITHCEANDPWVEYHVGMWHCHICTVAKAPSNV